MSEKKPSNPYAFPLSVSTPASVEYTTGMTLRDYFAAKALQGIVGSFDVSRALCDNDPRYDDTNFAEVVALNAYEFADAMLRAREVVVTAAPGPSVPPLSSADSSGRTG